MITVVIDGADRVLARMTLRPAFKAALRAIGEELRGKLAQYPGHSHSPVLWSSARQRRFYFAMRREAGAPPKYTRNSDMMSQRLGPSWAVAAQGDNAVVVGTRATYAPFVQSAKQQIEQHRITGWKTDEQAIRELENSGVVERIVNAAIRSALNA